MPSYCPIRYKQKPITNSTRICESDIIYKSLVNFYQDSLITISPTMYITNAHNKNVTVIVTTSFFNGLILD